jgi:hypothetical protein
MDWLTNNMKYKYLFGLQHTLSSMFLLHKRCNIFGHFHTWSRYSGMYRRFVSQSGIRLVLEDTNLPVLQKIPNQSDFCQHIYHLTYNKIIKKNVFPIINCYLCDFINIYIFLRLSLITYSVCIFSSSTFDCGYHIKEIIQTKAI